MELVDKVRVDRQIADKGVVVGESKTLLFALLADETPNIFKAVGAGFERL